MTKEILFKKLLKDLSENHPDVKDEYKYIGTGNPLSDILIIGKEAAISIENNRDQYQKEIVENFNFWINNSSFDTIIFFEKDVIHYNPLYPYKGQLLKKNNGKGNWGTSATWINYQKLYNLIFNLPDNDKINFHERVFITEVNSTPSIKTLNADSSSIEFRKKFYLSSEFIQSFPIIIISGVGYFKNSNETNEIEEIFNVKFRERMNVNSNPKQPYWIHKNTENNKILINTHQLSIGISNNFLKEIALTINNSGLINK